MRSSFCTLILGLFLPFSLFAQSTEQGIEGVFARLQQYDPLVVTLETDMKLLKKDRGDEQWQPAVFKILVGDSIAETIQVQVAARGNMRKKTCHFPPVKIRFSAETSENDSIAHISDLKLVTSCKNTNLDEEWVRKECLTYQLYNIVTDKSFRVKPAQIRFANAGKKSSALNSFSFFIESEREMAARLNARPLKPKVVSTQSLDPETYDRMALFEFMIGNTDWGVRNRHNIKVFYQQPDGPIFPVAYDFDYAALVGTDYALPSPQIPINSVQERFYMGQCRSTDEYKAAINHYIANREAILQHCENFPDLSKSAKRAATGYLEGFFDILRNPGRVKTEIEDNCGKVK